MPYELFLLGMGVVSNILCVNFPGPKLGLYLLSNLCRTGRCNITLLHAISASFQCCTGLSCDTLEDEADFLPLLVLMRRGAECPEMITSTGAEFW